MAISKPSFNMDFSTFYKAIADVTAKLDNTTLAIPEPDYAGHNENSTEFWTYSNPDHNPETPDLLHIWAHKPSANSTTFDSVEVSSEAENFYVGLDNAKLIGSIAGNGAINIGKGTAKQFFYGQENGGGAHCEFTGNFSFDSSKTVQLTGTATEVLIALEAENGTFNYVKLSGSLSVTGFDEPKGKITAIEYGNAIVPEGDGDPVFNAIVEKTGIPAIEVMTLLQDLIGGQDIQNIAYSGDNSLTGTDGADDLDGAAGNDRLYGGKGNDTLKGGTGNDTLDGGDGDDIIDGGAGVDKITDMSGYNTITDLEGVATITIGHDGGKITTGSGNDKITAGNGTNLIEAGDGNNNITTGLGNDDITTGNGNDTIIAGAGDNHIESGDGNDKITVGNGVNEIHAGDGNKQIIAGDGKAAPVQQLLADSPTVILGNLIYLGNGNNTVTTGKGNDHIETGIGSNKITAGNGDNVINAFGGNNSITTGNGNDDITTGSGNDIIKAGDGDNTIEAGGGNNQITVGNGINKIYAGDGDNKVTAGDGKLNLNIIEGNIIELGNGKNTVTTGKGNDDITTGDGKDTINAGNGDNTIDAGGGDDSITTGSGNDDLFGGAGNDKLVAGAGDDILAGGAGKDSLTGGLGSDTFFFDYLQSDSTQFDTVTDFKSGVDKLKFDTSEDDFSALATFNTTANLLFGAGKTTAETADQHLIYDSKAGKLYYDADGNGTESGVVLVAMIKGVTMDDFAAAFTSKLI